MNVSMTRCNHFEGLQACAVRPLPVSWVCYWLHLFHSLHLMNSPPPPYPGTACQPHPYQVASNLREPIIEMGTGSVICSAHQAFPSLPILCGWSLPRPSCRRFLWGHLAARQGCAGWWLCVGGCSMQACSLWHWLCVHLQDHGPQPQVQCYASQNYLCGLCMLPWSSHPMAGVWGCLVQVLQVQVPRYHYNLSFLLLLKTSEFGP